MPRLNPIQTPPNRYIMRCGSRMISRAWPAACNIPISITVLTPTRSALFLERGEGLYLHIFANAVHAGAAADAALLDPAMARAPVLACGPVVVDEPGPGREGAGEMGGALHVARPARTAEAVDRVVGALERIPDIAEGGDRHGRAELLLGHERRVVGNAGDDD